MLSLALTIVVTLLVVGLLLWAVDAMPWISPDVKQAIRIVVIVIAVLWAISLIFPGLTPLKVR